MAVRFRLRCSSREQIDFHASSCRCAGLLTVRCRTASRRQHRYRGRHDLEPGIDHIAEPVHEQGRECLEAVLAEVEHLLVRSGVERRQPVPPPLLETMPEQFSLATRCFWFNCGDAPNDEPRILRYRRVPNPGQIDWTIRAHHPRILTPPPEPRAIKAFHVLRMLSGCHSEPAIWWKILGIEPVVLHRQHRPTR